MVTATGPARSEVSDPEPATGWTPTRALGRAVLLTGLLLVAGVLLGRVDLIVLAAPLALGTAYALRRRPVALPQVWISQDEEHLVEGGELTATVSVGNPDLVDYDVAVARARVSSWLRIERSTIGGATHLSDAASPADRPFVTGVPRDTAVDLTLQGRALRWGRHPIGPAGARVAAAQGLLVSRAVIAEPARVRVYPVTEPFEAVEAMPRAAGLVGAHHSRRPGEGGELAGVRVFAPGDRLRRIDWRVSLRARQLHVAATLSDRDAEVVVLLDVLAEAGRSGGVQGAASVLDTTVRAAAAIAEHYLYRGDRVALLEHGPAARRLRPATGRRQYLTVLEWLLDVRAESAPQQSYDHLFGPQLLSADALVVVLTPLLDERSAQMLAGLARSGRFVVAVDTLPADLPSPKDRGWAEVAYRLWRLDRDTMIDQLREHGVPVVRWAGAGSLDQVLRDVARLALAPRVGGR
ncbi:DUF58 domain-containing protein [Micromonospora endolithica]|uniref:DUF58 domain-containing protein n=1 Tax=Micromonospora endolithica TaxID=230091 RepID=A0A3A9Z588_9ACTN|nr:DUF58 domain-containing protein [Micromonospora endolithica]RKN43400.1 DUF58 domain-containing protein [Micromonospora endolithica]TWJ23958.1 uncharacterized protein (DUF58 family) [Micromonospora endolithica]